MNTIIRVTSETIKEFAEKFEAAKNEMIPMLPFIKRPFHDQNFELYKQYSDRSIYLIDYIEDEYCLYRLYHLNENDDTLRITLILPSSWEKRVDIVDKSIANLKEWFLKEDPSKRFLIQILEFGEIEYYPTLSHYLIPTIIKNGFTPTYRMYMKRDHNIPLTEVSTEFSDLTKLSFSEDIIPEILQFYYESKNSGYFLCETKEELIKLFKDEFFKKSAIFLKNDQNKIIAGVFSTKDDNKIWVDNLFVTSQYCNKGIEEYILREELKLIYKLYPYGDIICYLTRSFRNQVNAFEKNGFIPFEFWVDFTLEK